MNPSYFTIARQSENTIVISKSKFITTLMPIDNYDDAIAKLKSISKKYSDATHNCYAFISNESATEQRFSDDGEPQGTAGMPMLDVLKKKKMYKTLAVVTRYFGGIKLGANGLVGAYASSVAQALDNANIAQMIWANLLEITASYAVYKRIEELCVSGGGKIEKIEYGNDVTLQAALPQDVSNEVVVKIIDVTQGKAKIDNVGARYVAFACR